jgi:hypothetical protein
MTVGSDRLLVEFFHFLFLERLLRATDVSLYALKGGVNLRFFHQSPRYSEDMDLDVQAERVHVQTLKKNGYKILADAAFRRVLATKDIVGLAVNDPRKAKHTETTQRFALSLELASGVRLPTKIEFSRRGVEKSGLRTDRIDPEVARRHERTTYDVAHYDASTAARQKIHALAGRPVTQARDAFDLYLLASRGAVDASMVRSIDAPVRDGAASKLSGMRYEDWEGQVLEYLEEDALEQYQGRERFSRIQLELLERLEGP